MLRSFLVLLFVWAVAASEAPKAPRALEDIVETEGILAFTDGSSYYVFQKDGTFQSRPVGESGRTIAGRWKHLELTMFEVTGTWSWVNGISGDEDRRMKMYVAPRGEPQVVDFYAGTTRVRRIYPVYFFIDEITKEKKA